jgi:hypothetical protein
LRKTGPVVFSILLILTAMFLPVCHLHPLLDKGAPDHCTICVSLHAAAPLAVHVLHAPAPRASAEQVFAPVAHSVSSSFCCLRTTRGPPFTV